MERDDERTEPGASPPPDEATAGRVRERYEALPYPPPVKTLAALVRFRAEQPEAARLLFHKTAPRATFRTGQEQLVAGCGTSEAARLAISFPADRITGIDVSRTSLEHTHQLKQRHGLDNLTLHELPLERVGELDQRFDVIVSQGVLHHLDSPERGLAALRDVLRPDGVMRLMVYARHGRAGVYMMQDYCRRLGIEPSEADLRALHEALRRMPARHPFSHWLDVEDLRWPAGVADLLLHPRDRPFTVPEVYAWLEGCGLAFVRWQPQAAYLPQCGALAGSAHAARLAELPAPDQHAAMELFRGTIRRHVFLACHAAGPVARYTVDFERDDWTRYVPLRLPAGSLDRTRRPGRSIGVLSTGQATPDLALPVDARQAATYEAIDGQRSIAEIVEAAAVGGASAAVLAEAHRFFGALWDHDLIAIDASASRT